MSKVPADVSTEEVMDRLDDIIVMWDEWVTGGKIDLKPRKDFPKTQPQAVAIIALSTHLFELAKLLRPHLPEGLPIVLMPVARAALETAMWVIWLDRNEAAAEAAMNEDIRQRRQIVSTLRASTLLPEGIEINAPEWDDLPTDVGAHARNFKQMLEGMGLHDQYVLYRMYSSKVHPGIDLADSYFRDNEDGTFMFRPIAPTDYRSEITARLLPLWLLKCARIVNYIDQDPVRRRQTRDLARQLNFNVDKLWA